jgi:hypothetical protein
MRFVLGLIAAVILASAAVAQDRIAGIESTIQSQIEAFQVDDFATAFTFASPNIKRLFGSPDRFGGMVKNGYPMVHRPSDVQFLELRRQGPLIFQKVLLRDANGAPHVLEYNMIETDQGWQIDGVQLLAAPPIGA